MIRVFIDNCDKKQEIKTISTIELRSLLAKEKIQLLDVRNPKVIKGGFIGTAMFVDYFDTDFYTKGSQKLDKNKSVYLYCKSGNRSGKASKILQKKGYKVYSILGGYTKWKTEN